MRRGLGALTFLVFAYGVGSAAGADIAPKSVKAGVADFGHGTRAILWHERANIASLSLYYGSGGEKHQPRGPFVFVEEDTQGSNPKFDVRDRDGVKWKVKLGAEAQPEVAASRLVWAAGYFTNDEYFLKTMKVSGLPDHLRRGQKLIAEDGTIPGARLKRTMKGEDKMGTWQWGENPFVDSREFNGLRALMALINNWDLKDSNNALYEAKNPAKAVYFEQIYMVSDLGAAFGTTGIKFPVDTAKGNLEAYENSKFITRIDSDGVDFGAPSRPALVETVNLPVFLKRVDLRWIGRNIPPSDARWLGEVLGRLTRTQIEDGFRAAGYSPDEVNGFTTVVLARIAALKAL